MKKSTKNSITVNVPGTAQAGSVIKVGAYTNGGVVAYAYIYVTDKTTKVKVENPNTEFEILILAMVVHKAILQLT